MTDPYVIESERGTITVPPALLSHIVTRAAETVDGARVRRPRRGLEVVVEDGRASVSLELVVRFGLVLPDVAREVQDQVGESLRSICEVETTTVDVTIEEVN
jgi:uncharacterized alkaline shock family protein YloU